MENGFTRLNALIRPGPSRCASNGLKNGSAVASQTRDSTRLLLAELAELRFSNFSVAPGQFLIKSDGMASVGSFWSFWFKAPPLTQPRIALAMAVALIADAMQLLLGPLGWTFADEFIDLAAMAAISFLIGFHPLLLPTFLIEVLPIVDMLPTWTACTATLLVLRRRSEVHAPPNSGPTIDAEVIVDPPPVPPSQNERERAGRAGRTP